MSDNFIHFFIEGKPTCAVTNEVYDITLNKTLDQIAHGHNGNLTTLDKIGEDALGNITFNYRKIAPDLLWSAISGIPASAVESIDDAVTKAHQHNNLETILEKLGVDTTTANLTYNGLEYATVAFVRSLLAGKEAGKVVANIAARDALTVDGDAIQTCMLCYVRDATADPSVENGAAVYIASVNGTAIAWDKIANFGDVTWSTKWDDILNKPTSAPSDIDDAVVKKHNHSNSAVLDKLSINAANKLCYNGVQVDTDVDLPATPSTQIDNAVAKAHDHSNKIVLDKLTANVDGKLCYNGSQVDTQALGTEVTVAKVAHGSTVSVKKDTNIASFEAVSPAQAGLTVVTMTSNTIDLAQGNIFYKALTGATTLTIGSLPTGITAKKVTLILKNANTYKVTWPSTIKWITGSEPNITTEYFYVDFVITADGVIG